MAIKKPTDLPPEIWVDIFYHLRRPVPLPGSRPHRSELRQPDLCAIAGVSKAFQQICSPLLYKVVVTDRMHQFIGGIHMKSPSHRRSLSQCQSLYIEFEDALPILSYEELLQRGGNYCWKRLCPTPEEAEYLSSYAQEGRGKELLETLNWLGVVAGETPRKLLPNLTTVAIGAIYGRQQGLWARVDAQYPGEERLPQIRDVWHAIVNESNIKHICLNDPESPLGLATLTRSVNKLGFKIRPTCHTVHFDKDIKVLPTELGRTFRWVADGGPLAEWEPLYVMAKRSLQGYHDARIRGNYRTKLDAIKVEIFGSTPRMGPAHPRDPLPLRDIAAGTPNA